RPLDGVDVLARIERRDVRAAAPDVDERPEAGPVRALRADESGVRERVPGSLDRLAGLEHSLALGLVRARAGDADRDQDDGSVDDVAAVAAPVSRNQTEDASCGRAAAHELEHDRGGDEGGERVREQARPRAPEAEGE